MESITIKPRGICARQINVDIEDGIIKKVKFTGGCSGNTQGVSILVAGMKVDDVIEKLKGIDCNGKGTSCPDQLAKGLEQYIKENA